VDAIKPKSMTRPKVWSEEVEEAYRFQLAGYRDEKEYKSVKKTEVLHKLIDLLNCYLLALANSQAVFLLQ